MPKLIDPVGKSKDDYQIFSELSKKLGAYNEFTEIRLKENGLTNCIMSFEVF